MNRLREIVTAFFLFAVGSCTPNAILNVTTALGGGDVPIGVGGSRGSISAVFVNDTGFRATFTTGVYDPQNQNPADPSDPLTVVQFTQFYDSEDAAERLEPNSTSEPIVLACAREWTVGGQRLIDLIFLSDLDEGGDGTAFTPGVQFFQDDLTDPDAEPVLVGTAAAVGALLGVDYQCESLLVFYLKEDADEPGGFRVSFEVILP